MSGLGPLQGNSDRTLYGKEAWVAVETQGCERSNDWETFSGRLACDGTVTKVGPHVSQVAYKYEAI